MTQTIEGFAGLVLEELKNRLGDEYSCTVKSFLKNNDIKRTGILISNASCHVSPVFYIDDYYDGNCEVEYTVDSILSRFYESKVDASDFEKICIPDFDSVKDKLRLKLINYEMNKSYLENVVFTKFLDLAVVYYVFCGTKNSSFSSITITRQLLSYWDISECQLLEAAQSNMKKYDEYVFKGMYEAIRDAGGYSHSKECEDIGLYILSNKSYVFGASEILNPDVLSEISFKLGGDLILLPSSIHEWIVLPKNDYCTCAEYTDMVRSVNKEAVMACDILSNNAYIYNSTLNKVEIWVK